MTLWYREHKNPDGTTGYTLASCEQLDADGKPIPGQEQVREDDPRVRAILNPERA